MLSYERMGNSVCPHCGVIAVTCTFWENLIYSHVPSSRVMDTTMGIWALSAPSTGRSPAPSLCGGESKTQDRQSGCPADSLWIAKINVPRLRVHRKSNLRGQQYKSNIPHRLNTVLRQYLATRVGRAEVHRASGLLSTCFSAGGKLLVSGNGGRSADAQHICG